jgi:hypothetical protein
MSLLDRLRQMMGTEQAAAPAPAGAGQARVERLAAMRAGARERRRKDMREKLAFVIDPQGQIAGALVKFVNLQPIADAVGAERWADSFPRIELMSESVIERELGGDTLHVAHGMQGFLLLFTQADLEDEAADDLCDIVFDEIRRLLLGDGQANRPCYNCETRTLLRMLDETIPFPFVPSPRPQREITAPPAALAGEERPQAAAAGAAATPDVGETPHGGMEWEEWRERSGGQGQFGVSGERGAPIAGYGASQTRPQSDRDVGRSEDRQESSQEFARSADRQERDREVGRSGERAERIGEFGRSEDRPVSDIDVGRSADRPGDAAGRFQSSADRPQIPAGQFGASAERAGAAGGSFASSADRPVAKGGSFGSSEDRVDGMADWGMSRDRATQEWFFGRTRGRAETETDARYVPMGRANTMFDHVQIGYRPFLETRRSAVTSYLVAPSLAREGNLLEAAALFAQATRYNALPALDLAILDRAMTEIAPRFEAGVRFLFLLPLSFVTLMRRSDRYAYFDRWATVPVSVRKFARFYCYQPSGEIGETPLGEIATMLRFAGREPVFAMAPTAVEMRRLAYLRARSMMLDADAAPQGKLDQLCQAGKQHQLTLYLGGTRDAARRRAAVGAGAAFVEGAALTGIAAIPARPGPVSVSGFIEEG